MGSTRSSNDETSTIRGIRTQEPNYGATESLNDDLEDARLAKNTEPNPLDMGQIMLLSMARISEPLTFGILFPFVQQMIVETGEVSIENVGYSVGFIEVAFSITQCLSLLYWARAADKFGRKPVLIASLFGALSSTALFGFCKHVWQMYACRFLAGVFGGNAMVIRTLFTENCDSSNQATAFAYFAFAANMGAVLGPTLGGYFAEPAKQWPKVFGNIHLFVQFPYALPCIVCAIYILASMILCSLYLKETRPKECDNPPSVKSVLTRKMVGMLGIYGWAVTVVFCIYALFPLYLFTPVSIGGQSKNPPQIASLGAANGLCQGLWLLIALPRFDRWLGTKRTFIIVSSIFPLFMLLPALANAFARSDHWLLSQLSLGAFVTLGSSGNMTFTSVQLLLNSCAPPAAIATVNGIAVAICGIVKSIFPAVINSIFAISVSKQILKGYLAWIVLAAMAAGTLVCALYAPEASDDSKSLDKNKRRVLEAEGEEVMESGQF
ncbi:hypothetical protein I302_104471 [Kwoniella bestiolae CBS 10118]|uniref:Major facilitator superfamily (MFS) profile domain-containing protein n=1 Tax=Kwoniella bestiolae CBS 10118 TaxID=1296100 RepID=A0A1B9GBC5_9TREE|nr:hypothetical protein I302_03174 [Kwoniella bestiolae CBS 10118]OCF28318.1 hypothetical protein I302_03174 [Kwoniella bestiolae CBS 10118]